MKRRTNISISPALYEKALALMEREHFDDFSGYLEHLIRAEYARRSPEDRAALDAIVARMTQQLEAEVEAERDPVKRRALRAKLGSSEQSFAAESPVSYSTKKNLKKLAADIVNTEAARIHGKPKKPV